jgi:hypothetical protein
MAVAVPVWRRVVSRCGGSADAEFGFASVLVRVRGHIWASLLMAHGLAASCFHDCSGCARAATLPRVLTRALGAGFPTVFLKFS